MFSKKTVEKVNEIAQEIGHGNLMVLVSAMMRYDNIVKNGADRGSMHAVYMKDVRKSKRAEVAKRRQKMTQNQIDQHLEAIYSKSESQK